jgi:hypothetical protein
VSVRRFLEFFVERRDPAPFTRSFCFIAVHDQTLPSHGYAKAPRGTKGQVNRHTAMIVANLLDTQGAALRAAHRKAFGR